MKFKIKTKLVSGIVFALLSGFFLYAMPKQIKIPGYDSGAPSPRIIPGACLWLILFFSIVLIIQSLVFKKEKIEMKRNVCDDIRHRGFLKESETSVT